MQLAHLFRHFTGLHLEGATVEPAAITLTVHRTAATAACPACRQRSRRVHSQYERSLRDEPLGGRQVTVRWRVRRFRCANRRCARRTFAEQAPRLTRRYARYSVPFRASLQQIGFALGGRPGERLCRGLQRPSSRMTLLRLVQALPLPAPEAPRVLGVDDWALRKGRRYGTLLVDQEQHRPIDLLPDRTAETLAAWLQEHPGVEIATRDRAGAYADGIRRGAPAAEQVADRFHVLVNLRDALARFLSRKHAAVQAAARDAAPTEPPTDGATVPAKASPALTRPAREQQNRRAQRVARYEAVRRLQAEGVGLREIGRRLHLARKTVRRFAYAESFPERQPRPPQPTLFTPYEAYLRRRWAEGCHTATVLWQEVRARGFRGGYSAFAGHLKHWRDHAGGRPGALPPAPKPVSAQQASWQLLQPAETLPPEQQAYVQALQERCPEVTRLQQLAHAFVKLVRKRQGAKLTGWLEQAEHSGVPELRGFARSLRLDGAAIRAMLRLPWSNGPTEGHINRLKTLKRQMYGRAGWPLLKRRFLLGP
jgi:transposase